jgi:hypothetical protein
MKPTSLFLPLIALILGAGSAGYLFLKQPQSAYQATSASSPENILSVTSRQEAGDEVGITGRTKVLDKSQVRLEAEISKLKSELADLSSQVSEVRAQEGQGQSTREPKESLEEQELRQQEETARQLQAVTERFNQQQEATDWSIAAAERIELALNDSKFVGLNVDNVTCRGAMCKLEINDFDDKAMDILQNGFRQKLGDVAASGMVGKDENGKTMIFVAQQPEAIFGE